jgi:hypothetical protein
MHAIRENKRENAMGTTSESINTVEHVPTCSTLWFPRGGYSRDAQPAKETSTILNPTRARMASLKVESAAASQTLGNAVGSGGQADWSAGGD